MSSQEMNDTLAKHHHRAHRLSRQLLSLSALLEMQGESKELIGLGYTLRAYSRQLWRLAHDLDLVQIALARSGRPSE
jgi:hypothetical protein